MTNSKVRNSDSVKFSILYEMNHLLSILYEMIHLLSILYDMNHLLPILYEMNHLLIFFCVWYIMTVIYLFSYTEYIK